MAADTDVVFSYTVVDELGVEASMTQYVEADGTQTLGDIATAWGDWVTLVNAVTSGAAVRGHVLIAPDLPGGLRTTADAGSRVEQTGVINFTHAGANKRWGFAIAALKNAAISGGKINLANADISALTTALLAAVAGGTYTNNTFQVLSALSDAFIAFRKRRRQQRSKSYEVA